MVNSVTGSISSGGFSSQQDDDPVVKQYIKEKIEQYSKKNLAEEKGDRGKKYRVLKNRKDILQSQANRKHDGDTTEELEYKLTFKVPKGVKNKKDYIKAKTEEMAHLLGAKVKGKAEDDDQQQSGGGGAGGAPLNQFAQAAAQTLTDALLGSAGPSLPNNGTNPRNPALDPNAAPGVYEAPELPVNPPNDQTTQPPAQPSQPSQPNAAPDGTPFGKFPDNRTIYNYDRMPDQLSGTGTFRQVDPALEAQLSDDGIMRDIASTLIGEAGQSFMGRVAVAANIVNRAQQGNWFGKNMARNATAPQQYVGYSSRRAANISQAQLDETRAIVSALVRGQLEDPTLGADKFRSSSYIVNSRATAHRDAANDPNSIAMGQISRTNLGNTYFRSPPGIPRYIINPTPGTFIPGRTIR